MTGNSHPDKGLEGHFAHARHTESEKTISDALIEALANFIKEKRDTASGMEPHEKVSTRQYLALSLFFSNVIIAYLTISSLLPSLTGAPVWRLVVQIVPLAIGSSYLAARSKEFQKGLLAKAASSGFLVFMAVLIIFIGAMGLTQLPEFQVPVKFDQGMTSFCAEIVDGFNRVKDAAADTIPPPRQNCAGSEFQLRGDHSIRALKLAKNYMITVVYTGPARIERYYLPSGVIWRIFLGLESQALDVGTVTPEIEMPASSKRNLEVTITRESPEKLVYVPSIPQCSIDNIESYPVKCDLPEKATTRLTLAPGLYSFKIDGCKADPATTEVTNDTTIKVHCT